MDVVRARLERRSPASRAVAPGPVAARLQRQPRRRLPGGAHRARPRLGRPRRLLADQIMEAMRDSGQMTDVDSDYQVGMPEVQVVPDRNKAADLGVSMAAIGETINAAIGGVRVGKFKDKGRRYDIRVRLLAQQRERPEDIEQAVRAHGQRRSSCAWPTSSPSCSSRRLQAITRKDRAARHHDLRERGARRVAGGRDRQARSRSRHGVLPEGYPRGAVRAPRQAFQESFSSLGFALCSASSSPTWCWPRSSTPSPIRSRCCWPCPSASAARSLALWIVGPVHQHLQHARHDPAHGHRQEELDPARGLHQPAPRAGASSGTRRCSQACPSGCGRS